MGRDFDDIEGPGSNDDPGMAGADSPAPVPPHERTWRHPSEIGFATVVAIDAAPINIGRTGRGLIGVSSVAGLVLVIALVLALQPDSLRSDPGDVVALTNSRLRVASFDYTESRADRTPLQESDAHREPSTLPPIASPGLSIGSRLVDAIRSADSAISAAARSTAPPESTSTSIPLSSSSTRAMGVLSESGEHLLTTLEAVEGIESIDIRLPDGRTVRGRILHSLPDLHIAVLSISDESTTGASADIKASGLDTEGTGYVLGQPVIVLVESPKELVVGQYLDEVVIALDTPGSTGYDTSSVPEGAPVVSKTGHLIGLCTHKAGRLGFIPVHLLDSALSKLVSRDVGGTTTLPTR